MNCPALRQPCVYSYVGARLGRLQPSERKKRGIEMEGYRWQLLPAHGKKSFLLGASEKLYISACAFKVEF